MRQKVTIKDVARAAGVSHPTVSMVIHKKGRIPEHTRERVQRVMERLHYQPNLVARGLVSKKTRVIGMIVPELDPIVQGILRVVSAECRRSRYGLMLSSEEYTTREEDAFVSVVDNWHVDGVLIYNVIPRRSPFHETAPLLEQRAPFVFINKYLRARNVDAVSVDNEAAAREAVDHLVALGHTRIGMLYGSKLAVDAAERCIGFKKALKAHGLAFDESICGRGDYAIEPALTAMRAILKQRHPPTAMFCANDMMAVGACRAIEEAGLRVPRDISLIGFDDAEVSYVHKPLLTTFQPPFRDIGLNAVQLLIKRIEQPRRPHERIPLYAKMIVRESTGPCKSS
jgi:LacI family transcriptional regulator